MMRPFHYATKGLPLTISDVRKRALDVFAQAIGDVQVQNGLR
ncbi:hypothetical protein [Burkholderia cepacia]|nr:hypothetical protein [Burkholderia cepacia]